MIASLFGFLVLSAVTARGDESARLMKYYGWFVGDWTVTEAGDPSAVGTLSVKVTPGERCQYVVFQLGTNKGVGLWGYDGAAGTWIGTGFASDGTHWKDVLAKATADRIKPGDSWESRGTSVTVDGTKGSKTSNWTIVDENTCVVKMTQRMVERAKADTLIFLAHLSDFRRALASLAKRL
ncbi:MAG: hypothetical protein ACQESR_15390 [Planctomycetota bacterium]